MLVASNTHIDARGAIIHSRPLSVAAPQPNLNREANLDNISECVDLDQMNQACRFAVALFFNDSA